MNVSKEVENLILNLNTILYSSNDEEVCEAHFQARNILFDIYMEKLEELKRSNP